jgi:uridine kinase
VYQGLGSEKVVIVQEDAYYKDLSAIPLAGRHMHNFDHPDAFDHTLLVAHIRDLLAGRTIDHPVYDYKTHTRMKTSRTIGPHKIIVLEGILILDDATLRELMDIKVYVDTPADICFIRRLRRDIEERGRSVDSVIDQYLETVRPMYLRYVEPTRQYADIIIPQGGKNIVAVDLLTTKIKTLLATMGA